MQLFWAEICFIHDFYKNESKLKDVRCFAAIAAHHGILLTQKCVFHKFLLNKLKTCKVLRCDRGASWNCVDTEMCVKKNLPNKLKTCKVLRCVRGPRCNYFRTGKTCFGPAWPGLYQNWFLRPGRKNQFCGLARPGPAFTKIEICARGANFNFAAQPGNCCKRAGTVANARELL